MRRVRRIRFGLLLCGFFMVLGCGGNGGGPSSGGTGQTPPVTTGVMGRSGGSVESAKGTRVTVSEGVLAKDTTFSIEESSEKLPLPSEFKPVSDTVRLTGSDFIEAITVRIPYSKSQVSNPKALVAASYDESKGKWEMCTIASKDTANGYVTLKTCHFSKFNILEFTGLSECKTSFNPIQDIFPVFNTRDYFEYTEASNGACFGISAFTKWYFKNKKATYGPLDQYFWREDGVGIGVATQNSIWNTWAGLISLGSFLLTPAETGYSLIAGLKLTGDPQILALREAGTSLGWKHAILVYSWTDPYFLIFNPNYDPYKTFVGMEKLKFDGSNLYSEGSPFYETWDNMNFDGFWHVSGVLGNDTDFENIFNRYAGRDPDNYSAYTGTWSGTFRETYGAYKGESGTLSVTITVPANGIFAGAGTASNSLFGSFSIAGDVNQKTFTGKFSKSGGALNGVFKTTVIDSNNLAGTYAYYYSGSPHGGSITFRRR